VLFLTILSPIIGKNISPAQENHTFRGTIKNAETGEALIGAQLLIRELPGTGVESNSYGFYSLTLPQGRYTIKVQCIGFRTKTDSIVLDQDRVANFELTPQAINMREVVIVGERTNTNVTSTETSTNKLEIEQVKSIPVLLGEKDILKTIQLFPGVKSAGEGSTGFYARGRRHRSESDRAG